MRHGIASRFGIGTLVLMALLVGGAAQAQTKKPNARKSQGTPARTLYKGRRAPMRIRADHELRVAELVQPPSSPGQAERPAPPDEGPRVMPELSSDPSHPPYPPGIPSGVRARDRNHSPNNDEPPPPGVQFPDTSNINLDLPGHESVKPVPLVAIPDDPIPHEGAFFDDPYVIDAPDLLTIEVLQALPGRPVTGEYLVRPDGTVGLGWYGPVHVRGLTLEQAKRKVILKIRETIQDEILGLFRPSADDGKVVIVPPERSDRVFIDIAEYNSTYYSVTGDVAVPGRNPVTGGDTILFALQNAGGFIATADSNEIYLYRPARGGAAAKRIKVDYEAILKGDSKANLQLFKGDRIVVGRNKIVQATVAAERAAAPLFTHINAIQSATLHANSLLNLRKNLAESGLDDDAIRERLEKTINLWYKTLVSEREKPIDAEEYRRMLMDIVMPKAKEE